MKYNRKRSASKKYRRYAKKYRSAKKKYRRAKVSRVTRQRTQSAVRIRGISKSVSMKPELKFVSYSRNAQALGQFAASGSPSMVFQLSTITWPTQGLTAQNYVGNQIIGKSLEIRFIIKPNPTYGPAVLNFAYPILSSEFYRIMIVQARDNNSSDLAFQNTSTVYNDLYTAFNGMIDTKQFIIHYDKIFDASFSFSVTQAVVTPVTSVQLNPMAKNNRMFRFYIPCKQTIDFDVTSQTWKPQRDLYILATCLNSNNLYVVDNLVYKFCYYDP